jgi:PAT family beta-lactamase induction signal transducer AmpG
MLVFLFGPEPAVAAELSNSSRTHGWKAVLDRFSTAVVGPFLDFMRRPLWPLILIIILDYKLGEGMTGVMSNPLYIALGFSLNEIAVVSKIFGFFSIVLGALLGGIVTVRFGLLRSLVVCGVLQALGNLFFVLQAVGGHKIGYLALCVTAENITGGMAGTALIAYISSLCSPAFTATQYALLSSFALLGRTIIGSTGGVMSEAIGWVPFFLLTTVASLPAIALVFWIERRNAAPSDRPHPISSLAH